MLFNQMNIADAEAALRAAAEAAGQSFDAIPDARPRPEALARARTTIGHHARQEGAHARETEIRPKPRPASSGAPRGSVRRLLGPKREKCFGVGRPVPLDREAKVRIATLARALMHPTEKGKHYGKITAKAHEVLKTLLWVFHNVKTGWCFPSYEKIAEAAGCSRDTVAEAIKMLEAAGILTWCNRLKRVVENGVRRVVRTSNSYRFNDPASKSEIPTRTNIQVKQETSFLSGTAENRPPDRAEEARKGLGEMGGAARAAI